MEKKYKQLVALQSLNIIALRLAGIQYLLNMHCVIEGNRGEADTCTLVVHVDVYPFMAHFVPREDDSGTHSTE